jgi:hypothetical protein
MSQFSKSLPFMFAVAVGVAGFAALYPSSVLAQPASQPGHGHEHKEGEKHGEDHGPLTDLGTKKIGTYEVQLTLAGEVKAGEEAVFIIKPKGTEEPKAVRAWVGVESGQGSIKTKAEEEKEGEWHAHHKVSKPMPANGKVWVELETAAGKQRAAFELKK